MHYSQIDKRYAKALYNKAEKENKLEIVLEDMEYFVLLFSNKQVKKIFKNNENKQKNLISFLKKTIEEKVSNTTVKYYQFLESKKRLNYLPEIVESFMDWFLVCAGIAKAKYISTHMPSAELKAKIQQSVDAKAKKKCKLEIIIDKKLIGGFCIELNNMVWNYSLNRRLTDVQKAITK